MNSYAPYRSLFKDVLRHSEGNFRTDYGYHLAPITREHLEEIPSLVRDYGVTSFKYYMFLRGTADPSDKDSIEKKYLLSPDPYDLDHLRRIMIEIVKMRAEVDTVRLSIHAEDPDLIRKNSELVLETRAKEKLSPMEQNNRARPPESECLAINQAAELAIETGCPINILHLSSAAGLETITKLKQTNKKLDAAVETTPHYLLLNEKDLSDSNGLVFPPIRTSEDSERLWRGIAAKQIDTVASDHCCSNSLYKESEDRDLESLSGCDRCS
jgi:dihydroorotase-like cyclic amidohydrolase